MPLILDKGDDIKWIDNNNSYDSVKELVKPIDDNLINMHEVSTQVNSVRNNTSEVQIKTMNRLF